MSPYVRSRTFCCCLPVRLGVFILSLLAMVGGSFVAAVDWIQISQLNQHPLGKSDVIALWIQAPIFSLLALLAVFGFIGALVKNKSMISGFAIALAIHLGFSIASGAFSLYTVFTRDSQEALDTCLKNAASVSGTDVSADTAQSCKNGLIILKAVTVVIYVITWLLQLYAYFVVERYAEQLDDERMATNTIVIPRAMVTEVVGGPQVTTYTGPTYPFTDSRQAFGATRSRDPSNMA